MYGIRAVLYLAANGDHLSYIPIRRISEELNISFHFLTKILQKLTEDGIIASYRGPNGGVALAKPAQEISVMDMINAVDGSETFHTCVLGLPGCGEESHCPLHDDIIKSKDTFRATFENTNLLQLGLRIKEKGLSLV